MVIRRSGRASGLSSTGEVIPFTARGVPQQRGKDVLPWAAEQFEDLERVLKALTAQVDELNEVTGDLAALILALADVIEADTWDRAELSDGGENGNT